MYKCVTNVQSQLNDKSVIKEFSEIANVKQGKGADSRFLIVDKESVLMMMTDEKAHPNYDSGVWVEAPYFVNHFGKMIEKSW